MAIRKACEVSQRLTEGKVPKYDLIIGAHTIIYMEGKIYGKPKNSEEAAAMLKAFIGKAHAVYTGVCVKLNFFLLDPASFSESTKVYFGKITEEVVKSYVDSGEPLEKVGAYDIEAKGGTLIEKIEGDYFNVLGLPLHKLSTHLFQLYKEFTQQLTYAIVETGEDAPGLGAVNVFKKIENI